MSNSSNLCPSSSLPCCRSPPLVGPDQPLFLVSLTPILFTPIPLESTAVSHEHLQLHCAVVLHYSQSESQFWSFPTFDLSLPCSSQITHSSSIDKTPRTAIQSWNLLPATFQSSPRHNTWKLDPSGDQVICTFLICLYDPSSQPSCPHKPGLCHIAIVNSEMNAVKSENSHVVLQDKRYTSPVRVSELFMSRRRAWMPEPAVQLPWATVHVWVLVQVTHRMVWWSSAFPPSPADTS